MKMFCGLLKEHAMKITTFAINKMIPLARKARIICFSITLPSLKKRKKYIEEIHADDKEYCKVQCYYTGKYRGDAHNSCNLRYGKPREIPIIFDNGFKYDYNFITAVLPKEFEE